MINNGITQGGLGEKWLADNEEADDGGDSSSESEEEDDDENLPDGVFIRSSSSLLVREHKDEPSGCVIDGGGFAVLQQSMTTSEIELIKISELSPQKRSKSKLLRNGDAVLVRLKQHNSSHASPTTLAYLSTHRGWWLKWVTAIPKHNGTFVVCGLDDDEALSVGRPFKLRHHRWCDYVVGISPSSSAKYGGRHLGLLKKPLKNSGVPSVPSDGPENDEKNNKKKPWMEPLHLCAFHSSKDALPLAQPESVSETTAATAVAPQRDLTEAILDIPAWIEVMHRTKRKRVLAYVVRAACPTSPFVSLRTGAELTPIMNLRRNSVVSLDEGSEAEPEVLSREPSKIAALMSPPDQSTRILSELVLELETPSKILKNQLQQRSELDAWFLHGGAAELGVVPGTHKPLHECVVARALWESHWREEWCGIYRTHIAFYAPLSRKPSWVLYFKDVLTVRLVEADKSPLPGLFIFALDTPGRVHYIAFNDEGKREGFTVKIKEAIFKNGNDVLEREEKHAPEAGMSDPREMFVLKSGQWAGVGGSSKSNRRVILNARRMRFDEGGLIRATDVTQKEVHAVTEDKGGDDGGEKKSMSSANKKEGEGDSAVGT
jgi:hypothetical protein